MVFKGFNIEYPVYSVVTPQSGEQFDVRSLKVIELDRAKHSIVTPVKATSMVNELIWTAIQNKPGDVKDYKEFSKRLTTLDRESLLYGIYVSTFGDELDLPVQCQNLDCTSTQLLKIKLSNAFSVNPYIASDGMKKSYDLMKSTDPDSQDKGLERQIDIEKKKLPKKKKPGINFVDDEEEIEDELKDGSSGVLPTDSEDIAKLEKLKPTLTEDEEEKPSSKPNIVLKKIEKVLPISKIIAFIRQPTIYDQEKVFEEIPYSQSKQNDIVMETMVVEKFIENVGNEGEQNVIDNRLDIITGYESLPVRDKKCIYEIFAKEFGQYRMDLKTSWICKECGYENEVGIDITQQFFRMVASS